MLILPVLVVCVTFPSDPLNGSVPSRDVTPGASPDPQRDYVSEVERARKSLFTGDLEVRARGLRVGAEGRLTAVVSGGWRASPNARPDRGVDVGARVAIRIDCLELGGPCEAHSSPVQNVLAPGDRARWEWSVRPDKAGPAHISFTATAYYLDSDNVLAESVSRFTFRVAPGKPSSGLLADIWGWVRFSWDSAVHIATGLGAIIALFAGYIALKAARRSRERRSDAEDGPDTTHAPDTTQNPGSAQTPAADAAAAAPQSS
ncbi:hypothetical protein [Streptomyces spectabilis]|uniref:Uncharacterized protein n=1 Tax=Streptomyces spectabilis TaxID=68270 RepID=A0A516R327_STRST|nr:hypothetical protein [Streptomyces spectabilis]QDQ10056.1 hypothetical protein FH965_05365 [Streptomyces spectabilis]